MSKHIMTNKEHIEKNRKTIIELMHISCKTIDGIHMLRHEVADVEPMILAKSQMTDDSGNNRASFIEWANLTNISNAYKFILENKHKHIDWIKINKLHNILIENTEVPSGFRNSMAMVLGQMAPSANKIYHKMDEIEYHLHDTNITVLTRAFDTHFDIIETQPFNDYNKRTARLVMNWFLIQHKYTPIIFNKKSDSKDYNAALRQRINGNRRAYTEYMEISILHTQKQVIKILNYR